MVKIFFAIFFIFTSLFGDDILNSKITSFIGKKQYLENQDFINIIFNPTSSYYENSRIDNVKIIKTLKENGLLNLFFSNPQEFNLTFKTSGSPIFFLKIMGDTLRDMGYYRYVTTNSNLNASEFSWSISLNSEYATDPLILKEQLLKRGCDIIDISRINPNKWIYSIDMTNAHLNIKKLISSQKIELKRSLYAHWLDVSEIKLLNINSSIRNSWHPHISFYDNSLHLLNVIKQDSKI